MSKSGKDTLLRYLETLALIPATPGRISSTTLVAKLKERGYDVSSRTLQRDLVRLSGRFPISCEETVRPFRWYRTSDYQSMVPDANTSMALAVHLAEPHLRQRLPDEVYQQLQAMFYRANEHLQQLRQNHLAIWPSRICSLPTGKTLIPAVIAPEVWEAVTTALMTGKQLRVRYNSRSKSVSKELRLHPLGLVVRDSVSYLVCTTNDYTDEIIYALHRLESAEVLEQEARNNPDFSLEDYIRRGKFGWMPNGEVTLVAEIDADTARMLSETPLSLQQKITALNGSNRWRLEAIVPDDQETRWWVYGMNTRLKVLAPEHWVEELQQRLQDWQQMYSLTEPAAGLSRSIVAEEPAPE